MADSALQLVPKPDPATLPEPRITLARHPLLDHHMTILRNRCSTIAQRRISIGFVTMQVLLEATRDLPMNPRPIQTPLAPFLGKQVGTDITIVEVLRASTWMRNPAVELFPSVRIGCIGTRRKEESAEPENYYCNLPPNMVSSLVLLQDIMLATGGSAVDALRRIIAAGADKIKLICVIAAPEGVRFVNQEFPKVEIFGAALDQGLNDDKYIVPGLGDAGDLLYGT